MLQPIFDPPVCIVNVLYLVGGEEGRSLWPFFLSHSSEIRGLCLMKWIVYSEMMENLSYFWNKTKASTVTNPKLLEIKYEKNYIWVFSQGFLIPKIWQILKCFARQFYQA